MPSRRIEGPNASEVLKGAADRAEEIKAALRLEIHQRGLSERDLADELGFGPTYLTNLFVASPGRTPTALKLETLIALLAMLELDLVEFLSRAEPKTKGRGKAAGRGATKGHRGRSGRRTLSRKDYELFSELLGVERGSRSEQVREIAGRAIDFVRRHSGARVEGGRGKG